ncbi:MAG: hypothetical protein OQK66_07830 [Prosthecochloris sp.]|uniref:Uncharacterized protein n=1 Tax=Prosthecochloris aestuarii (strain DSM 271 / SK 413) TaxID=290512 RepID=B4S575_PROA2|nr:MULTISPECIES: hypothetical protein [Prosthecochloris]ACF47021.1 hypothetical protein Paes_2011 [Prosthecochloris aestuarii DSM 271]MCW8798860.1 hypothetical protein [Prosthecochloris sp.]
MPGKKIISRLGRSMSLRSFQAGLLIYDGTLIFCDRFLHTRPSVCSHMTRHAFSAVCSLSESVLMSGSDRRSRQQLVHVASERFQSLQNHYEAFLEEKQFPQWGGDEHEALVVCKRFYGVADRIDRSDFFAFSELSAATFANTEICLIRKAVWLLTQQSSVDPSPERQSIQGAQRKPATRFDAMLC